MKTKPTKILCEDTESPRHWLVLPPALRKWGQAMLHQQCWCWGQDIKRGEGNLLLAHGFARTRAPEGYRGSPTYHKSLDERRSVTLWGFGMAYSEQGAGSVFLSRSGFVPRYSPRHEMSRQAWKAEHMAEFQAPRTADECQQALRLLCEALLWLGHYEGHVLHGQGAPYRTSTLQQWDSHAVLAPQEAPAEWARLSSLCRHKACICTRGANGIRRTLAQELSRAA